MAEILVVTRHAALVNYLAEKGIIPGHWDDPDGCGALCQYVPAARVQVLEHATAADVAGRHVIGVLPLHLAALAASVTVVPLTVAREERGEELGIERLREVAGEPVTYTVRLTRELHSRIASDSMLCIADDLAPLPPACGG